MHNYFLQQMIFDSSIKRLGMHWFIMRRFVCNIKWYRCYSNNAYIFIRICSLFFQRGWALSSQQIDILFSFLEIYNSNKYVYHKRLTSLYPNSNLSLVEKTDYTFQVITLSFVAANFRDIEFYCFSIDRKKFKWIDSQLLHFL